MKRSSIVVGVSVFVLLGAVGGGLAWVKYRQIAAAASVPAFEPPTAVQIVRSTTRSWQPVGELVGTVVALRSVTSANEVGGLVTHVGFESGDIVEAGQVLVKLDDATERAELRSAEAMLKFALADVGVVETRIKLAESELRRQRAAVEARASSAQELDRAQAEFERTSAERERALATVEQARAQVEEIRSKLDKLVIRAPFRARVGLRSVHEGQFLSPPMGETGSPVARLVEVAPKIYVDFAVPQERVAGVVKGMVVEGEMEGGAGAASRHVKLEVAAVDATADSSTRNVRVRAIVDNTDGSLRPGMFLKVRVPVEAAREFVVVPVSAVRRASYADQVFIIASVPGTGPDGKPAEQLRASQRFVKLGTTIGDEVIVLEGLKAGEQIAAGGSFKLRDGALVMPGAAGGAAGGAAPGSAPGASAPEAKEPTKSGA